MQSQLSGVVCGKKFQKTDTKKKNHFFHFILLLSKKTKQSYVLVLVVDVCQGTEASTRVSAEGSMLVNALKEITAGNF